MIVLCMAREILLFVFNKDFSRWGLAYQLGEFMLRMLVEAQMKNLESRKIGT